MQQTIGIDIAKDTLDAYRLGDGHRLNVDNNREGHRLLLKWIGKCQKILIVFEATGPYHRELELVLGGRDVPFVKVNPKQARRFAQATGRLAKTDRVDAAMLARMGAALELQAQTPRPKSFHDLRELLAARRALIKDRAAAKIRRSVATLPLLKRQLEDRLALIDKDVKRIDTELARMAALDPDLSRRVAILQTIPGVGEVTAVTLTIDMPELGELEGKQAASLAGLAPVSQQSGRWQGKERIQGGRAALRQALYFPAIVAARFNVDLKLIYDRLTAAGKQKKVALVAIMRRLIVMANALIRDNRPWAPNHT
ncbi:IS110 family transposase [Methylorubrum extorquens]|uniref:IS110 family transposase n=5 Tax=Methylobacteriaceae TaxID=119045 RepID=A0A1S1P9Z2_METEX|nr:IS110 family transposase [Methylorubrum extorquens]